MDNEADTAGIVLELRVVQPCFWGEWFSFIDLPGENNEFFEQGHSLPQPIAVADGP
jgi:hypothetical protein